MSKNGLSRTRFSPVPLRSGPGQRCCCFALLFFAVELDHVIFAFENARTIRFPFPCRNLPKFPAVENTQTPERICCWLSLIRACQVHPYRIRRLTAGTRAAFFFGKLVSDVPNTSSLATFDIKVMTARWEAPRSSIKSGSQEQ